MFDTETRREIERVARARGWEAAALLAVAEVESAGKPFAIVDGRKEPLIRFEGHYFDKRLSGEKHAQARAAGLANPKAGAVKNPSSQAARWKLLKAAMAIDEKAALESVSWGVGQVMGAHWAWLGYGSVQDLVLDARNGVYGQVRLMAGYIDKAGLAKALTSHNWNAFAKGYNGPNYAAGGYHTKLASAYSRYAKLAPLPPAAPKPPEKPASAQEAPAPTGEPSKPVESAPAPPLPPQESSAPPPPVVAKSKPGLVRSILALFGLGAGGYLYTWWNSLTPDQLAGGLFLIAIGAAFIIVGVHLRTR